MDDAMLNVALCTKESEQKSELQVEEDFENATVEPEIYEALFDNRPLWYKTEEDED